MKITLPTGCAGLTMQDGTTYGSRPGESVEVTKPHHIQAIRNSPNAPYIGDGRYKVALGDGLPDNRCPDCGFNRWPWSASCTRCGAER